MLKAANPLREAEALGMHHNCLKYHEHACVLV